MSFNTLGSLSTLDSGFESFGHSRTQSQNSDPGSLAYLAPAKRKLLDNKSIVVTEEFLAKTKVQIDNPEHAKILAEILKKHAHKRFPEELSFIREACASIPFFEKMDGELPKEDFLDLLRMMTLREYSRGDIVFNHGDIADEFYIIIRGAVLILSSEGQNELEVSMDGMPLNSHEVSIDLSDLDEIQEENIDEEEGSAMKRSQKDLTPKRPPRSTVGSCIIQSNFKVQGDQEKISPTKKETRKAVKMPKNEADDVKYVEKHFMGLSVVKTMKEGESFGEMALHHRSRRTGAAVCKEKTIFGVIAKKNYDKLISKLYEHKEQQNLNFLRSFGIFEDFPNQRLGKLYLQLKKREYPKNHAIYKQGQNPELIYFIKEGSVELTTTIDVLEAKENANEANALKDPFVKHRLLRVPKKEIKRLRVDNLEPGQFFGHEEHFDKQNRKVTATVSSANVILYTMSVKRFSKFARRKQFARCLLERVKAFDERLDRLINQNQQYEIKMATKVCEINKQQRRNSLRADLEKLKSHRIKFRGFSEEPYIPIEL